jgi:hypothetical protein
VIGGYDGLTRYRATSLRYLGGSTTDLSASEEVDK